MKEIKSSTLYKGVFLDRDGVINEENGHVKSLEDFNLIVGAGSAIKKLNSLGVKVAVLTNQSGIARGYITENELFEIHQYMRAGLLAEGGKVDFIAYSPWLNQPKLIGGVTRYLKDHQDRKPNPGMINRACEHFKLCKDEVCYIGDTKRDMQAAQAAGVDFYPIKSRKAHEFNSDLTIHNSLFDWMQWACENKFLKSKS